MDFEKIELEKKEALLKQVGVMYRNCETKIEINSGFMVNEKQSLYTCVEVKGRVDLAMKRLNPTQRLIIENEYLKNTRENWYLEYFYERAYLKTKQETINVFLHCLYG